MSADIIVGLYIPADKPTSPGALPMSLVGLHLDSLKKKALDYQITIRARDCHPLR